MSFISVSKVGNIDDYCRRANGVSHNTQHHLLRPADISTLGPEPSPERAASTNNNLDSLLRSTEDGKITAADPGIGQEIVKT